MLKIKTFIIFVLTVSLTVLLVGCRLINNQSAQPEPVEVADQDGELPAWLLLDHRTIESPEDENDPLDWAHDEGGDEPDPSEIGAGGDEPPATGGAEDFTPAPAESAAPESGESDSDDEPLTRSSAWESIAERNAERQKLRDENNKERELARQEEDEKDEDEEDED